MASKAESKAERLGNSKYNDYPDSSDSEGDEIEFRKIAPSMLSGRRGTVMAAPIEVASKWSPPHFSKSEEDREILTDSITKNILFSDLKSSQLETLVDAMQRKRFDEGDEIITQGDDGDMFYVVVDGTCEVFVRGQGKVAEIKGNSRSNYFGELALLYDSPRAASVRAVTDVLAWGLDRVTFKTILQDVTQRQRLLYRNFLDQVPILESLTMTERLTLADALSSRKFAVGDKIISEGETGDECYIVEEGEVKCTKGGDEEEVCDRLGPGDYFGELALLNEDVRKATVTVVRACKLLVIDRQTFLRLLGPLESKMKERMSEYKR